TPRASRKHSKSSKSLSAWFFFFSSRRRHTRFSRDWSSDVCSSDLGDPDLSQAAVVPHPGGPRGRRGRRRDRWHPLGRHQHRPCEIGRASCRERVQISLLADATKNDAEDKTTKS